MFSQRCLYEILQENLVLLQINFDLNKVLVILVLEVHSLACFMPYPAPTHLIQ